MATAACKANIDKYHVGFRPCTDNFCISISYAIGDHCSKFKPPLNPDDPIGPQMDPNLDGPGKAGYCYCCCSCFGGNTPIEAKPDEYWLAKDIHIGDQILTAGKDLRW